MPTVIDERPHAHAVVTMIIGCTRILIVTAIIDATAVNNDLPNGVRKVQLGVFRLHDNPARSHGYCGREVQGARIRPRSYNRRYDHMVVWVGGDGDGVIDRSAIIAGIIAAFGEASITGAFITDRNDDSRRSRGPER